MQVEEAERGGRWGGGDKGNELVLDEAGATLCRTKSLVQDTNTHL